MKKLLFILLLLPLFAKAQIQGYNLFPFKGQWYGGAFNAIHVPAGTSPALTSGQWNASGALFYDSTGVDTGLYVYHRPYWVKLGGGSSTTPGIDDVLAVAQALTANRTIDGGSVNSFQLNNVFAYQFNTADAGKRSSIIASLPEIQLSSINSSTGGYAQLVTNVNTTGNLSYKSSLIAFDGTTIDSISVNERQIRLIADSIFIKRFAPTAGTADSAYVRDWASGHLRYKALPTSTATIGGSIASGQVAVGSGANTIAGSSAFTFSGGTLTVNNEANAVSIVEFQDGGTPFVRVADGGELQALNGLRAGNLYTSSTSANSNLWTFGGTLPTELVSTPSILPNGTRSTMRVYVNGTGTATITAGRDYGQMIIGKGVFTEGTSGTHPRAFGLAVLSPSITDGVGATDTLVGLYVQGGPSGITAATGKWSAIFGNDPVLIKNANLQISGGNIVPFASDGAALGTSALQFSDLFLASTGVINWNNGGSTITESSGTLVFAGATTVTHTIPTSTATTTASGIVETMNSLTSGTGHYISTNSLTSGSPFRIVSTSTVLAANNAGLTIDFTGANGTNNITAVGFSSSVANTNATSGRNTAALLNATGATTSNRAIDITAGDVYQAGGGQKLTGAFSKTPTGDGLEMDWTSGTNTFNFVSYRRGSSAYGNIIMSSLTELHTASSGGANTLYLANGNVEVGSGTAATSSLHVTGTFALTITSSAVDINVGAHHTVLLTVTAKTATLPTAVGITGREYTIKLTVAGTGTVATTSSQTIDGSTTYSLASQYKYVTVQSDGSNWHVIANN